MAKTFISEEVQVKLQVLNLAAKLCLVNPKQTKLLTQYVLNLAKYDQNYDIRDRARFIRVFLFPAPGQVMFVKTSIFKNLTSDCSDHDSVIVMKIKFNRVSSI